MIVRTAGKILLLILVGVLTLGILLRFVHHRTIRDIHVYESLLQNEYSSPISLNGTKVRILEGHAEKASLTAEERSILLRIGWYHAKHRIEPLFSLSGADIARMEAAIAELRRLSESIPWSGGKHEATLSTSMHPFSFLERLPELERLRRELALRPSLRGVYAYHTYLKDTLSLYQEEIENLIRALASVKEGTFVYLSGETTMGKLQETLNALMEAGKKASEEESRRFRCFRGTHADCSPISYAMFGHLSYGGDPEGKTGLPDAETARLIQTLYEPPQSIVATFSGMVPVPDSQEFVVLTQARCGFTESETVFSVEAENERGIRAIKVTPLSEAVFFKDFSPEGITRRRGSSEGIGNHLYYEPITVYMCPDSGHDRARVLSTRAIYAIANTHALAPLHGALVSLENLETELRSGRTLSDSIAEKYVIALASFLADPSFRSSLIREDRTNILAEMERRVLLWRDQSAGYEKIVGDAWSSSAYVKHVAAVRELRPSSVFVVRILPSVFFLPFNATVTEAPVSFFTKKIPVWEKEQKKWVSLFSRDLRGRMSVDDIVSLVKEGQQAWNLLLIEGQTPLQPNKPQTQTFLSPFLTFL